LAASDPGLIFAWEHPRSRRFAITGFLFGSLLLHALGFYIFQIVYPPAVALLPPPGRVNLIAPNSAEGRLLLRWLDAEDPALASTTQPLAGRKSIGLPTIQHAPSYLTQQPALKEVSAMTADVRLPSAHPPGPVEQSRAPIETPVTIVPTTIRVSPELGALGAVQGPEMKFVTSLRDAPDAARFRVAADANGEVRYCFLETSSGDPALDEQARKYLSLSRFPSLPNSPSKIGNDFVWGIATVEWGNDLAAPPPPATGPVAP
jgi:hypothetical protein